MTPVINRVVVREATGELAATFHDLAVGPDDVLPASFVGDDVAPVDIER